MVIKNILIFYDEMNNKIVLGNPIVTANCILTM